jgi:hypothetical protein
MKTKISILAALPLLYVAGVGRANAAALKVVTPGEQNTKSGENGCGTAPCAPNGCAAMTCAGGTWKHYPEILSTMLGTGYVVSNNGDGGAILGCDPNDTATANIAGGNSFCKNAQYTSSITPQPDIVIIGPFGEHDQRIVAGANMAALYKESIFEAAYDGLVQRYMKGTTKIYMMTPIDMHWTQDGAATALNPATDNIVTDLMLPAAMAVAQKYNLPVIDSYTAISGTAALITMYHNGDGQTNSAGQQKMAALIMAALNSSSGTGGAGGATGAAGAGGTGGGAGGAGGATGAAGAGGASAGAGGSTTTGAAGTTGTGAAGTTGTTGAAGTTGTGAAGTTGATGAAGATGTGAAGTTGGTGAAGSGTGPYGSGSGGGCSYAARGARGPLGAMALLAMLTMVVVGRRRARRR